MVGACLLLLHAVLKEKMEGTCQVEVQGDVTCQGETLGMVEGGDGNSPQARGACWVGVSCVAGNSAASSGGRRGEEEGHGPYDGGVA